MRAVATTNKITILKRLSKGTILIQRTRRKSLMRRIGKSDQKRFNRNHTLVSAAIFFLALSCIFFFFNFSNRKANSALLKLDVAS